MAEPQDTEDVTSERLVEPGADDLERAAEAALRPRRLEEFVGQRTVREQLSLVLDAARGRGRAPDHVLLAGPPGLGKTTLAMIIAAELGASLRVTSGPAIQHAGDLAAVLSSLEEGEVLFIDEIHRLARPAEELLYVAMEDFRVDVVVGKGPGASAIPLALPPFTVVGATTRSGLLTAALRDRFGIPFHFEFYHADELTEILRRSSRKLRVPADDAALAVIAARSRGTPRVANRLLRRIRDFAQVRADGQLTIAVVDKALDLQRIDQLGLDELDRAFLTALIQTYRGGPAGIEALAATIGQERDTLEDVVEPYLLQIGFVIRTKQGRVATRAAYGHLGVSYAAPVETSETQPGLFDEP